MLIIISEEEDISTDYVCNWLNCNNIKYFRINSESNIDLLEKIVISNDLNETFLRISNKRLNIDSIRLIWFRRGHLKFKGIENKRLKISHKFRIAIERHISDQSFVILEYLYYKILEIPHINNPFYYNANKLISLEIAKSVGLTIPYSLITKSLHDISILNDSFNNIITKSIRELISYPINSKGYYNILTNRVHIEKDDSSTFWYSLFQQEIVKKYELRVFYFLGYFFCAAIFSQQNLKTEIDFRNMELGKSNATRIVPYKLPKILEKKINKFMQKMHLESGSLDFVVDMRNNYYFLEVNPVGQYDFVNKTCNYYIEKFIANQLAHPVCS